MLVTPHVGVWIETPFTRKRLLKMCVTPHVGVWIETLACTSLGNRGKGHTSCRCVD